MDQATIRNPHLRFLVMRYAAHRVEAATIAPVDLPGANLDSRD
jgi:hypothetical protein